MTKSQPRVYTQLVPRPYRYAIRYYDIDRRRTVIEMQNHYTLADLIESLLLDLSEFQPDLLIKVAELDDSRFMGSPRKTRRYLAKERDILYIDSPHLTEKHSKKVGDHWMITNIGRRETYAFLGMIGTAAGVKRDSLSKLTF